MGVAAIVGAAIGRRAQPMPSLAAAVLVLLLVNPFLATNPGFALSVVATAGIVLAARPLTERMATRMPRALAAAIAVPVVAQVACTPLLILYFGQLTPWAVPANVLAAPAVAPATILGVLAAVVATFVPMAAALLAWAAAVPARWLAGVARFFGGLPGSGAHAPSWLLLLVTTAGAATVIVVRRLQSPRRAMLGAWR
jgi:competence protein ComEC